MRSIFREERKRKGTTCLFAAPTYCTWIRIFVRRVHHIAVAHTVLFEMGIPLSTETFYQAIRPILNSSFKLALLFRPGQVVCEWTCLHKTQEQRKYKAVMMTIAREL